MKLGGTMKNLVAIMLLAAVAAYGQAPSSAQGNTAPQLQDQQQQTAPAPQQQPAAAPEAQATPQPTTAPETVSKPQPTIATTNRLEAFNGPTLSEIYCSGFITREPIHPVGTAMAGSNSPEQAAYGDHG